jgi:hypothetical protein
LTSIATADVSPSMWKKSIPSAMSFAMAIRWAERPRREGGTGQRGRCGCSRSWWTRIGKLPRDVSKTSGRLGRGQTLNKEGAQSFVPSMSRVGRIEEPARQL